MPATQAESAFGSQIQRGNGATPEVFIAIAEVKDFDEPEMTVDTEEVTNHGSPGAMKERIAMLIDNSTMDIEVNWIGDTSQVAIRNDLKSRTVRNFRVLYPPGVVDEGGVQGIAFRALVVSMGRSHPVEGILSGSFSLQPIGEVTDLI